MDSTVTAPASVSSTSLDAAAARARAASPRPPPPLRLFAARRMLQLGGGWIRRSEIDVHLNSGRRRRVEYLFLCYLFWTKVSKNKSADRNKKEDNRTALWAQQVSQNIRFLFSVEQRHSLTWLPGHTARIKSQFGGLDDRVRKKRESGRKFAIAR